MRALVWHGAGDIRYDNVCDSTIEDDRDVIVKVTTTAICGSDLHLMNGVVPEMREGDILGHEFMGEVVIPFGAAMNKGADYEDGANQYAEVSGTPA